MQSVSSKIWTRVAVIISYDDNHYTTGTSNLYSIFDRFKSLNGSIDFWIEWIYGGARFSQVCIICHFVISFFVLLKMTQAEDESSWEKYGAFLNSSLSIVKWITL